MLSLFLSLAPHRRLLLQAERAVQTLPPLSCVAQIGRPGSSAPQALPSGGTKGSANWEAAQPPVRLRTAPLRWRIIPQLSKTGRPVVSARRLPHCAWCVLSTVSRSELRRLLQCCLSKSDSFLQISALDNSSPISLILPSSGSQGGATNANTPRSLRGNCLPASCRIFPTIFPTSKISICFISFLPVPGMPVFPYVFFSLFLWISASGIIRIPPSPPHWYTGYDTIACVFFANLPGKILDGNARQVGATLHLRASLFLFSRFLSRDGCSEFAPIPDSFWRFSSFAKKFIADHKRLIINRATKIANIFLHD